MRISDWSSDVCSSDLVTLTLPLGPRGGAREVVLDSLDAFHPDELHGAVDVFAELAGLRRRLNPTATFQKAAAEVQSWAGGPKGRRRRAGAKARGGEIGRASWRERGCACV